MKTFEQKKQILLAHPKIHRLIGQAIDWYFDTDFNPINIGGLHVYAFYKGRTREQLELNALEWLNNWADVISKQNRLKNGYIEYYEGTSQCLSLWMNGDWIMYEVPHDPEVSDTFGRLGLRLKRDRFYRSMKNVTLLRVARSSP